MHLNNEDGKDMEEQDLRAFLAPTIRGGKLAERLPSLSATWMPGGGNVSPFETWQVTSNSIDFTTKVHLHS